MLAGEIVVYWIFSAVLKVERSIVKTIDDGLGRTGSRDAGVEWLGRESNEVVLTAYLLKRVGLTAGGCTLPIGLIGTIIATTSEEGSRKEGDDERGLEAEVDRFTHAVLMVYG